MAKKIMIVDDEEEIVHLLMRGLMTRGYLVCVSTYGLDAVKMANEESPDMILLDYKMPAGSGLSVFQGLKMSAATANIPVMFITACPFEEVEKKAWDMGAVGYIKKPFTFKDLIEKIDDYFSGKKSPS